MDTSRPLIRRWLFTSLLLAGTSIHAFVPHRPLKMATTSWQQHHSMTADKATDLPMIETMRAGEIKKELESYGVSTVSFLEKKELVNALTKARSEGLKPKTPTKSASSSTSSTTSTSSSQKKSETSNGKPRSERLQEEMDQLKSMKASEMKKELEQLGVSTKSFFEKQEFMKALAEARVDGVKEKESYAEYTDVEVLTDEFSGPRPKGQQQQSSSSNSPYGGPVDGPGSVGGMGIADILKNMGAGGAGRGPFSNGNVGKADPFEGANPFGGGGGNPFGGKAGGGGASPFGGFDSGAFSKAQTMMKNPKVQEIIKKAQSNPATMKKINECMSNPAAFSKYQNDPDVADLIKELRNFS